MEGVVFLGSGTLSPSKTSRNSSLPTHLSLGRSPDSVTKRLHNTKMGPQNLCESVNMPRQSRAKRCIVYAIPEQAPHDAQRPGSAQHPPLPGENISERDPVLLSYEGLSPCSSQDPDGRPANPVSSEKPVSLTPPASSDQTCVTAHSHVRMFP